MLLLLWLVNPVEAACVERVSADTLILQVQALIEPVAFAEDSVAAELAGLEATLRTGCINETVPRETLGALFMAQGAYELLRGGDPQRADALLRRAAALTAALEPAYGPKVEEAYRAAVNGMRGDAVLELSFPIGPEVVVVDGEVVYDAVERRVLLGSHLVQWYSAELGWSAEWVDLNEWGERRLVGGGPPLPDELPVPTDRGDVTTEARSYPSIVVYVAGGYALSAAPVVETDDLTAEAVGFAPAASFGVRAGKDRSVAFTGRVGASTGPLAFDGADRLVGPRLPYELRLMAGTHQNERLGVGAGLLVVGQPQIVITDVTLTGESAGETLQAPSFTLTPAAGPVASATVSGGDTLRWSAGARVAWTLSPKAGSAASGALQGELLLPLGPAQALIGAELGALRALEGQAGPWIYPHLYGGLSWSR